MSLNLNSPGKILEILYKIQGYSCKMEEIFRFVLNIS